MMLCKAPYLSASGLLFGCGQCLPCRINKRRVWTCRNLLESLFYNQSSFITLTYNNENLPSDGSISKRHLQLFFKRLRKDIKFRYFACGEYGEQTSRPHYHAILYGVPITTNFEKYWTMGHIHVGEVNSKTIQYVAGYVSKKIGFHNEKVSEFLLMSKGLGAKSLPALKKIKEKHGLNLTIRYENKIFPVGRYLANHLKNDEEKKQIILDARKRQLDKTLEYTTFKRYLHARDYWIARANYEDSKDKIESLEYKQKFNKRSKL